jgi:hypothetical protein
MEPMIYQTWRKDAHEALDPEVDVRLIVDASRQRWRKSIATAHVSIGIEVRLPGLRQSSWSVETTGEGDFRVEFSRLRTFLVENLADLPSKTLIHIRVAGSSRPIVLSVSTDELAEVVQ